MLEDLTPPSAKRTCKVGTVLEGLSDKDKDILTKAIYSSEWTIKGLSRALIARGIQLSESPLTTHRNKSCACHA
jgi:DNA-binding CsgD family transcriptional regulator